MMQRARHLSDAIPPTGPVSSARHRPKPNPAAIPPAALTDLPQLLVAQKLGCRWHGCTRPAAVRVSFALPSLLAGEARDYCRIHGQQAAQARGAVLVGRLRVVPAEAAR